MIFPTIRQAGYGGNKPPRSRSRPAACSTVGTALKTHSYDDEIVAKIVGQKVVKRS